MIAEDIKGMHKGGDGEGELDKALQQTQYASGKNRVTQS